MTQMGKSAAERVDAGAVGILQLLGIEVIAMPENVACSTRSPAAAGSLRLRCARPPGGCRLRLETIGEGRPLVVPTVAVTRLDP